MNLNPVILAGGSGTRLWPLSREVLPKQFLSLIGGKTLFQRTIERARLIAPDRSPIVVCNAEHYFHCEDQVNELGIQNVRYILEPFGRDTAGAIALAALLLKHDQHDKCPMLIMPSDHLLDNIGHFKQRIDDAMQIMTPSSLVTFGITANTPETGYGYIERGDLIEKTVYQVKRFVEKPNLALAQAYIQAGSYFWNSGIFMFTPHTYLRALSLSNPMVANSCELAFSTAKKLNNYHRIDPTSYELCPKISIDYAVLEKSTNIVVVPLVTTWSDLGSWSSVADAQAHDSNDNVNIGNVLIRKSKNCYINAQDDKLIAALGLDNLIIVNTSDALLVAHKNHVQDVKELVTQLKVDKNESVLSHKRVSRPWGYYESLVKGEHYQVKHIMVKPMSRLSLQSHQHRSEHWVVVSGTASIVNGTETLTLNENESTYIPQGNIHRLSNLTQHPLHVIEVQTGSYISETDIVRLQDDYARAEQH